jgi:DNA-binding transcriptional ArsR family regulator
MGSQRNRQDVVRHTLENPLRLRILELAIRTPGQLTASGLKDGLTDEFMDLEVRRVHYHLTRLQDADLLPRPLHGS